MSLAKDDTVNQGLVALTEDVFAFGNRQTTPELKAKTAEVLSPAEAIPSEPYQITNQVLLESPRPPAPLRRRKELKTAAELAAMIELDLAQHPECPKNGFRVTVYGATDWRAMLTITPAAGRVREPQQWRGLTHEFADRLRQRYDLAWE